MGPPYRQTTAILGETPNAHVDVPISAVFIALYVVGAAAHMARFRINLSRGHKFLPSAATFGFCMTRIAANSLRIAWGVHPADVPLSIAAQIFVAAGVVILFILNLLYAQRILRAVHPAVGWSGPFSYALRAVYVLIILTLIMVITVTVQSFYTLDTHTRLIDADILRYGTSLFATVASLPFAIIAYVAIAPRNKEMEDHFGQGSLRAKCLIVTTAAALLSLGAWFRAGINYESPRPVGDPAWYHSKACFYIFNFSVEIIVVYLYLLSRVDLRFHVPDGSSKRRHYGIPASMFEQDNVDGQHWTQLRGESGGDSEGPSFQMLDVPISRF